MFPTCSLLGSVLLLNAVSWDGPLSLKYIKSELGWLIPSHIADKASLILSYRGPRQAHLSAAAGQATCWPQFSSICSLCFLSASQAAPSVPRDSCLRGSLPGATAEESRGPSQHSTPPTPRPPQACFFFSSFRDKPLQPMLPSWCTAVWKVTARTEPVPPPGDVGAGAQASRTDWGLDRPSLLDSEPGCCLQTPVLLPLTAHLPSVHLQRGGCGRGSHLSCPRSNAAFPLWSWATVNKLFDFPKSSLLIFQLC